MPRMGEDLTEFLLARIAEDEAGAPDEHYAPFEREWEWCPVALSAAKAADPSMEIGDLLDWGTDCTCGLPARRRRVLAECEAKREQIRLASAWSGPDASPDANGLAESLLEAMALPYADHPDYCEEWRP